jgi:hypothetical protein
MRHYGRRATLVRYHAPIARETFVSLAFGPVISFKSEALGFHVRHRPDVPVARSDTFYYLGANPELAVDQYLAHSFLMHVGVGGYARLSENMSYLCEGADPDRGPADCLPDLGIDGTVLSRKSFDLYLRLGIGWHY